MVCKSLLTLAFLLFYNLGIESKAIFNGQASDYTVVYPQLIRRWARTANRHPETKQREDADHLAYYLNINDSKHILHLEKNRDFLSKNFAQFSHDTDGNSEIKYPEHDNCYYHGRVEGHEDSLVALSTCSGLRGVILIGNKSYGIEPVPQSENNDHLLYHLKHSQSEAFACGVTSETSHTESHSPFDPDLSFTLLRRKRNLPQTRYVELALVADKLRYELKERNETAVRQEMVELANLLDGYFKQLNIRVVLVALEIFKVSNPFDVEAGTAADVLARFVMWRKKTLLPRIRHDVGQLIVGKPTGYPGRVLGMAFVGTVCSAASSGGISVFNDERLNYISTVVAHEMGHTLGMTHDDDRCACDGSSCIMSATASGSTSFSKCSGDDFEKMILRGGGVCLKNQPSPSEMVSVPKCGNGVLEKGEQCDCGTAEECTNKCCDAATCMLTPGSVCAQGSCCNDCQIKVAGTPCRGSVDTCDLPEFCNGDSGFCPSDFYIMDGLPCESNTAYCYEGRCQTYDYQCKHLFDKDATKAADTCFQHANTKGDLFGNCGMTSSGTLLKCSVDNAMCGKVQCSNIDTNNPPHGIRVGIQVIDGSVCINADFNLGSDVLDPGYVNPGSPCAKGKTCLDFKCVNASALLPHLDCDARTTCNGRGLCNDQGHCHCENGWGPPHCDTLGRGGSVDSGPALIDYSLRNGLLIFFLLVVPILVLLVLLILYMFKRDFLRHCFKGCCSRRHRSQNTANGHANSQTEGQTTKQPEAHSVPPQTMPGYPKSVAEPSFSTGKLDYWNTTAAPIPPQPPVLQQGPGVPRPFPSKQTL